METQKDYWNGPAGKRWAAAQERLDQVLAPFADVIFDAAELPDQGTVFDVGCGCGATTLMLARRAPELRTVGFDVSEAMLEVARARAGTEGLSVRFELADAAVHRPAGGPADLLLSRFGLMFFEDRGAAFSNLRSWLRSGGRLITTMWGPVEENPWATPLAHIARRYLEIPSPPADGPGPFSLHDGMLVDGLLRDSGFEPVQQTKLALPMRIPGSLDDVVAFYLDFGAASDLVKQASGSLQNKILDELRDLLREHHDGSALSLGASSRLVVARASG